MCVQEAESAVRAAGAGATDGKKKGGASGRTSKAAAGARKAGKETPAAAAAESGSEVVPVPAKLPSSMLTRREEELRAKYLGESGLCRVCAVDSIIKVFAGI